MNRLPEPQQPTATPAGQPTPEVLRKAAEVAAAVDAVYHGPTSYRDHSPLPAIGPTPPVAQPGQPPMSQKAADISGLMKASSLPIFALGTAATGTLWASGHANPLVIAFICAAPPTLAIALSRLMKGVKQAVEATPTEHHHHYNAPVYQDHRSVNTQTRGVWATTRNELPR
ncbi:hypothetical protein SSOG_09177 [Streptomyces himastatinicus ATCC 53653]|uniref:Uncharacterized protein n=1 Tax=Streptomyces himastatinicus ATCC 53653 TaxID=457427 RepID=D9WX35_9ACTN|nr:hypothetical protein [Streptomyces himastatinicus]EFL29463.1 hypothetical protein SSOG_09177 [Streptomyces himastatinicus ATCC 53653]